VVLQQNSLDAGKEDDPSRLEDVKKALNAVIEEKEKEKADKKEARRKERRRSRR
jgi:Mor family transcriptional regulator